ncbi:MAG TPA: M48 family metalloprotease [Thermoleophilaceae bacterium]|nr:M48 family metalloprotease [Thermoleophilaceae bacterium]
MELRRSRLPLAIVVAAAAAVAATLVLRPRSGLVEPAAVEVTDYFSAAELERARDFREPQRLIALAGLAVSGGTLALLALRPPRRLLEPLGRRPLLGGAAAGAGISIVLVAANLPLAAVSHERSVDVGLSTQDWGPWLGDVAKAAGVEAVFAAGGGALALALMRRFRRNWWAPMAACAVAVGVVTLWLFPVVVDPLFNDFERLPDGKLRSDTLALAREARVDVGEVYRVDASRRTTAANAYVGGLGPTKRVVLFDNLIEGFPPEQVRSVVAHELAHQKHRDIWRGIAWLALVAPAGTFLAQRLTERIRGTAGGPDKPGPGALPALALSLALVGFALGSASNVLSRQVEGRADAFSLRLTGDPAAHIDLERRLARVNVSDPDPPALLHALFGTHPTTVERIGIGEAWARSAAR